MLEKTYIVIYTHIDLKLFIKNCLVENKILSYHKFFKYQYKSITTNLDYVQWMES